MSKLKMTISLTCKRNEREIEARAQMGIVLQLLEFMNKGEFQIERSYVELKNRRPSKRKPKSRRSKNG